MLISEQIVVILNIFREWPWNKIGFRLDEVDSNKKKNLMQTMTRLAIGTVLGRKGNYGHGKNPVWNMKVFMMVGG